jgi:formylmethanofuran dehydrogenase subunit E
MSSVQVRDDVVNEVVRFHGHMCPGLAIGIRAAEIALQEIGPHAQDEEVVCVTETDMCAVDAIQYLTGCTFGKGNLIHLDHGKNAFTFYRRSDGKGIRIVTRPDAFGPQDPEREVLRRKIREGVATSKERERFWALQQERARMILQAGLDELFEVKSPTLPLPSKARIHRSLPCAVCGETVMETRVRLFDGQSLCITCFEARERRW